MASKNFQLKAIITLQDRLSKPLKQINRALGRQRRAFRAVGRAASDMAATLGRVSLVAGGAVAGLVTASKNIVDVGAEFERYEATLKGLTGSQEAARKAMDWVVDFARSTTLELSDVMQAFIKFKAFGLDPMDGSLQALVDTGAKYKLSQQDLMEVAIQLGQAFSQNVLLMNDMRPMMSRGVPVIRLLAESLGKTEEEIVAMRKAGQLGRKEITLLIEAMGKEAKGAQLAQMKTWGGMLSTLSDHWKLFRLEIAKSGVFEFATRQLSELLAVISRMAEDGSLKILAKRIAKELVAGLQALRDIIIGTDWGALWKGIKESARWTKEAVDAIGGLKGVLIGVGVVLAGPLISGLAALTMAMAALGTASLPVLAAVTGVALAAKLIYDNWDGIEGYFSSLWDSITQKTETARNALADAMMFMSEGDAGAAIQAVWQPLADFFSEWPPVLKQQLEEIGSFFRFLVESMGGGWILESIQAGWGALPDFFQALWDRVAGIFEAAKAKIASVIEWIAAQIQRLMGMVESVRGIASSIGGVVSRGIGAVQGFFGGDDEKTGGQSASRPALAGAASANVNGEMTVKFENAPQGMRASPGKTNQSGLKLNPDVGYRSQALGMP